MKSLPVLLLALLVHGLSAQITVSNATFPTIGDTLHYAVDAAPPAYAPTPPGGNQIWDYSGLQASSTFQEVYKAAASGSAAAEFPGATMVAFSANGQTEDYFKSSTTSVDHLGFKGALSLAGAPFPGTYHIQPSQKVRQAPLNFFDINQTSSNITQAFYLNATIQALLQQFGLPSGIADSVRIRVSIQNLSIVDGYGSLKIPGGTYEVLRQKQTNYRSTSADIHASFLGWIDISTLAQGIPELGIDTAVSYQFLSNTDKEIIATVNLDASQSAVQSIAFKNSAPLSAALEPGQLQEVLAMPNPAVGKVFFDLKNLPEGAYKLQLYSLEGRLLLAQALTSGGELVSLDGLEPGLCFYRIFDKNGEMKANGKFVIGEKRR